MRPIIETKALEQCTDQEIDAELELVGEGPMTPDEIRDAQQARLVGRAELRSAIFEDGTFPPGFEEKLRNAAAESLDRLCRRAQADLLNNREEIAFFGKVTAVLFPNPSTRAQVRLALAHQFLGFTAKGYDAELRSEAEDAERIAAAEREESRRREIDNAH